MFRQTILSQILDFLIIASKIHIGISDRLPCFVEIHLQCAQLAESEPSDRIAKAF